MVNLYKASAGSGKTYRLTLEYLKFLFSAPDNYRHILAVTFTNKATEEMKERILHTLYGLAYLPREIVETSMKGILSEIVEFLRLQGDMDKYTFVRELAEINLKALLHDYSSFSVSTIDRFFQGAIRAFAREIGRNNSYNVELDSDSVTGKAIDNMLAGLDKPENRELLDWLTIYSVDAVENGSYWDIKNTLSKMADQLGREEYKIMKGRGSISSDKKAIKNFKDKLVGMMGDFEVKMKHLAADFIEIKERYGIEWKMFRNFQRFRRIELMSRGEADYLPSLFEAADNFEDWVTRTMQKKEPQIYYRMEEAYRGGLNEALCRLVKHLKEELPVYLTASSVYENIYLLGVLADIDLFMKEYAKDNNLMLLSDSGELLRRIIDGSDTPFIYEKIGIRTDNYMLDEFQDTSAIQWDNFKPLIADSLAAGNDNLIVGDVKQSIYRWRGSDRELLNSGISNDLGTENVKERSLLLNFRSGGAIVGFNNGFFTYAAAKGDEVVSALSGCYSDYLTKVYSDTVQEVPEGRGNGYLKIEFFGNITCEDGSRKLWNDAALERIPAEIERLRGAGYSYREINVLVRSNKEGAKVINYLLKEGYPVMSGDSLVISQNRSVNELVSMLRFLNDPENKIAAEVLNRLGIESCTEGVSRLHLPEMCQQLASKYLRRLDEDTVFVASFLDIVNEYVKNESCDLDSFLEWWKSSGSKRAVSSPPQQDAINIMTIHKSKGLSLKSVIIPFAEWPFRTDSEKILWIVPDPPFNDIGAVPVRNSSKLAETAFSRWYMEEELKNITDVLNVAYVAFTRASDAMIIFAKEASDTKSGKGGVSDILYEFVKEMNNAGSIYEAGSPEASVKRRDVSNVEELCLPALKLKDPGERLKIKLKSELYYENESIKHGIIMHEILSRIESRHEVNKSVDRQISEGRVMASDREELLELLNASFESVKEREWFTGRYEVLNENDIIAPGGEISRPDRVMLSKDTEGRVTSAIIVDFKFGEIKSNAYIKQVSEYAALLEEAGIPEIEGYVWYIKDNQLVRAR